jgi:hypothetical protein
MGREKGSSTGSRPVTGAAASGGARILVVAASAAKDPSSTNVLSAPLAVLPPPDVSHHSEVLPRKRSRTPDLVVHHKQTMPKKRGTTTATGGGILGNRSNSSDTVMMNDDSGDDDDDKNNNSSSSSDEEIPSERPIKWLRAETRAIPVVAPSLLLQKLPEDLLLRCLLYVNDKKDRCAIQSTARTFRRISNTPAMIRSVDVSSILVDDDTPDSAGPKLEPFAAAGNLLALYMYVFFPSLLFVCFVVSAATAAAAMMGWPGDSGSNYDQDDLVDFG